MDRRRKELDAIEFPAIVGLVSGLARTRSGAERLGRMLPWDGKAATRRGWQMEIGEAWGLEPSSMPILPFDEALDQLLSPAGWLLPEHWRQLRDAMVSLDKLINVIALTPPPEAPEARAALENADAGHLSLKSIASSLPGPMSVAETLSKCFNDEGQLDPLKVPSLSELHKNRARAYQRVQNSLQKYLADSPDAFMEATVVERNGRFCLPVRLDRKSLVQGLVLDRSGSGATAFIEPFAAVSLNNEYMEADAEYREAVLAFLRGLLASLRSRADDFARWRDFLADADETIALLQWSRMCDGALPRLDAESLALVGARHPLLLPKVRSAMGEGDIGHDVVPLDLLMGADMPCLVISGSNTGGKTVALKTVGLLAAVANCGCAVPAKAGTEFPPMASLHADIGDHQTLIGSLSTFSSHIMHLKMILGQARKNGLVLLDELGTGTDPREGAALGIAILDALSSRGAWVLCSTHLGEISQWALKHPRFQNASVQFDEDLLAPTYRLLVGQPGQSRAITIAEKLGLPKPVLAVAKKKLGRREQDWREFLRQLEAERSRLLEESDELAKARALVEKDMRILADREAQLRHLQEKFKEESSAKLARVLDFAGSESKRLVKEMKAQQKEILKAQQPHPDPDKAGAEARERVKTIETIARMELAPLAPKAAPVDPKAIHVGMYARHRSLRIEGKVTEVKGKNAILETAPGRSLEAPLAGLEPLDKRLSAIDRPGGRTRVRAEYADVESELNLIGRASDEVEFEIHRFIESALASGNRFIRIVHGHGTGRLKKAVRDALHGHPGISAVEDAPQAQGGAGATLVTLK